MHAFRWMARGSCCILADVLRADMATFPDHVTSKWCNPGGSLQIVFQFR